jgi:hypothetical protein
MALNARLAPGSRKRFEFVETAPGRQPEVEPGFEQFLEDGRLSKDATEEELEFLRALRFRGRTPSALYYYRELQSLRDPLHFPSDRRPEAGAGSKPRTRGGRRGGKGDRSG